LFVLNGHLEVRFDHETIMLSEGSAFTYDCRIPHILANPHPQECAVLMCHAPRPTSPAPSGDQAFADFLYQERSTRREEKSTQKSAPERRA
jgi:hypothetical protein